LEYNIGSDISALDRQLVGGRTMAAEPGPRPNLVRLLADLEALAQIVEPDTPGWTRRFPSAAYLEGRAWVRARMEQAGLKVRVDAGANILGELAGSAGLPAIMLGSHTDTVMGGGRYDGPLGVLAALEVARCIQEAGVTLRHPLIVGDYLAEEVNPFGVSCVGSRALAGRIDPEWLTRTAQGRTLAEAIAEAGGQPEVLGAPLLGAGALAACLELHIEQGPVLEQRGIGLAAVSGIVGIRRGVFELHGRPDHAGTTPMAMRHDALAAASALVLTLEELCRAEPRVVGTVGRLDVYPNQGNVVPAKVTLAAEVRSLDPELIEEVWSGMQAAAEAACAERGVELRLITRTEAPPAAPPLALLETVLDACRSLDPQALVLPSGAGHDTGHLGAIAPSIMIFVPSVGGRSHCPEEYTEPAFVELGAQALLEAVLRLDRNDNA
jgi:beta-ureidopropionase / N-carbamoyl-L-amino-acid hydrolase